MISILIRKNLLYLLYLSASTQEFHEKYSQPKKKKKIFCGQRDSIIRSRFATQGLIMSSDFGEFCHRSFEGGMIITRT